MATYYIAVSGSTGNTGLSTLSPWPLSQVNTFAFVAGDNILFQKGDIFNGNITLSRPGSSGNPITVDLYGTASHNPIIDNLSGSSPVITISANYITINNLYCKNSTSTSGIIAISAGHHDITLNNVALNNGIRGINALNLGSGGVVNLLITNCWIFNITDTLGGGGNTAHGGGSHIQLNNCTGSGIEITNSKFYTRDPDSSNNNNFGVGDIISLYQSNGTPSSYILVHNNQIRGGSNNQVTGYIGITALDVGGSYQHIYNNILVNSGQGGIGIMPSGGTNAIVENNRMYSKNTGNTNNLVGMGFNDAAGVGNCTMQNNNITWYATGKTGPYNKFSFQTPPTGWNTNTADTAVDPLATEIMLPDPLFNEYDWDTTSSITTTTTTTTTSSTTTTTTIPTFSYILIKRGKISII